MEYSLVLKDDNWNLAFHMRGSGTKMQLIDQCCLALPKINEFAYKVVNGLNVCKYQHGIKSLIIRKSCYYDDCLGILYLINKAVQKIYNNYLIMVFFEPKSPVSFVKEILKKNNNGLLREKVLDMNFIYPFDSFFQNNMPMFEIVLKDIKKNMQNCQRLVDVFCKVGVLGIVLNKYAEELVGV
jgi:23S rRNA (uracil1939-C5)-methyltransferase